MKGNTQDLTKGSIVKAIILFSIPLLIGNLFQQLYNAVDSCCRKLCLVLL